MSGGESAVRPMPCRQRYWRRGRRGTRTVIHALDENTMRAGTCGQRAACGRKVRIILYFGSAAPLCPDCKALVPQLAVPAPGAVLARELNGPPAPVEQVDRLIEQQLAAYGQLVTPPSPRRPS